LLQPCYAAKGLKPKSAAKKTHNQPAISAGTEVNGHGPKGSKSDFGIGKSHKLGFQNHIEDFSTVSDFCIPLIVLVEILGSAKTSQGNDREMRAFCSTKIWLRI